MVVYSGTCDWYLALGVLTVCPMLLCCCSRGHDGVTLRRAGLCVVANLLMLACIIFCVCQVSISTLLGKGGGGMGVALYTI